MSFPNENDKTVSDIRISGGVTINVDGKTDEGYIREASSESLVPDTTKGWAIGASLSVDQGDGTSKTYINVGDPTSCRFLEVGKQTTVQEHFAVVHNANVLAESRIGRMAVMFNMKLARGTFGVAGAEDDGGAFASGDDGGLFIFSGAALQADNALITHDATPPGVPLYAKIVGRFIQVVANLGGTGMSQFESENGGIFLVQDDPNAALGYALKVNQGDDEIGFTIQAQNGRFYIRDVNGKEFTVNADGSSSPAVYFDRTVVDPKARLFSDLTTLGAADVEVSTVSAGGQQNTSDGIASIIPYFVPGAEEGEEILHGFTFVPINFTAEVFGSNKLIEILYNPNASSLGVDFYYNGDSRQVEADLPDEEDSFFSTSARFTPMQNVTI